MALDIGIGNKGSWTFLQNEPQVGLTSSYYDFLFPLLQELAEETELRVIDLYEDSEFSGEQLNAVERLLEKARCLLAEQPESWQCCLSNIILDTPARLRFEAEHPELRLEPIFEGSKTYKIYETVRREIFLDFIERWLLLVRRAKELDSTMICKGD